MAISIHDVGVSLSDGAIYRGSRGVWAGDGRAWRFAGAVCWDDREIYPPDGGVWRSDGAGFLSADCAD